MELSRRSHAPNRFGARGMGAMGKKRRAPGKVKLCKVEFRGLGITNSESILEPPILAQLSGETPQFHAFPARH